MSAEDLRAILGLREESFAAELAAHRLDQVSERRVLGRARRARGMRVGVSAAAAAAVAAIAGVGVWALMGAHDREPLVTPPTATSVTVSASPTPTPSPSPSPTLDAPAFSTSVATGEGFLQAAPMTAQLWNDVEDGWILSYWAPDAYKAGAYDAAIYLQDPDGSRYEVSHFSEPGPWHVDSMGFWEPGNDFAVAQAVEFADGGFGSETWGTLDLISGVFTPIAPLQDAVWSLGTAPDGSYLFSTDGDPTNGVLVVARDLSSAQEWVLDGGFAEGHLSPDGSAVLDMRDGPEGTQAFTVRSSVDGTVLWTGSEAAYGGEGTGDGEQYCAWSGWAGDSDLAIVCTWHAVGDYGSNTRTDVYRAGADGSGLLATLSSDLKFTGVQPAGDGIVGEGIVNLDGADSGEVYYVDRPGVKAWRYRGKHGIWPTFMVAGDVEAVGWNGYGPGSAMARNLSTGTTFDVVPARDGSLAGTGSAFSLGVVLVGSPVSFQVYPG